jgi:mannose-6-phosphate isomerase-like protein (cupin superfamily)
VLVKSVKDCPEFLAGDHTILREMLNPAKAPIEARYSLAQGRLERGRRSKRHRLGSTEVYYFLAGRGRLRVGDEEVSVEPGMVVYIPPGATQSLENTGPVTIEFLCLVDPAWQPQDEEILE